MVRFLTTLVVAATSMTVQAKATNGLVDPVGQWTTTAISVDVFAPPDVTEALVTRVFDEANAIWGPTGIILDWHRITSLEMAVPARLTVTIDDDQKGLAGRPGALGWIPFTADDPAPAICLSRANAEALIRQTLGGNDRPIAGNEILIGRALGRALAHELGHYLLKSKVHTRSGLMRATWPSDELLSPDRRGFALTVEQRAAAERASRTRGREPAGPYHVRDVIVPGSLTRCYLPKSPPIVRPKSNMLLPSPWKM